MDERFIGRTYRTSVWVLILAMLAAAALGRFQVAWSIAAGTALFLLVLRGFEWGIRRMLRPGQRRSAAGLVVLLTLIKLPALTLIIYLVVRSGWFHLPAFAGGVILPQAVMFLKAFSHYLDQVAEDRARARGEEPRRPAPNRRNVP